MAKVLVATKFIGFLKFSGGRDMSWTVSKILSFNIFVQSKYSYLFTQCVLRRVVGGHVLIHYYFGKPNDRN